MGKEIGALISSRKSYLTQKLNLKVTSKHFLRLNNVLPIKRITFILLSFISLSSFAQSYEVGLQLGASNYHGDLAPEISLKEFNPSAGIFYRYNLNERWALKPHVSYSKISGTDQNFKANKLRNLSFENTIYEAGINLELNFKPFSQRHIHQRSSSYAFIGIAAFRHNPKAEINGEFIALQPLSTEGQEYLDRYKLLQIAVPFGGGIKHNLTDNWIVGLEIGWRRTFTDYLDDVSSVYPNLNTVRQKYGADASQLSDRSWEITGDGSYLSREGDMRGDPALKDWYFQSVATISYRFTPIVCWPSKSRRRR